MSKVLKKESFSSMNNWIDVNEKLPDDSVEVLGLFQYDKRKLIDIVSFSTGYDGIRRWYFECPHIATSYKMNEQDIKHLIKWMPMPAY